MNLSHPKHEIFVLFSSTTICGGRHDFQMKSNDDASATSRAESETETEETRETASMQEVLGIDWVEFAYALLSYNTSAMCNQTYEVGSGEIKQTLTTQRTCRCVLFDQLLNSYTYLKQFGRMIRPLLYGKIFYHPSTPQYVNLIREINQTFQSLDELIKLFRHVEDAIVPAYQTVTTLCRFLPETTTVCRQLKTYGTPLALFTIVTEFMACSERNRFVAKGSEEQMVRDGQNDAMTNTFLAGIEFLDGISGNNSLPTHVRYKIRMILDHVDNTFRTEDR